MLIINTIENIDIHMTDENEEAVKKLLSRYPIDSLVTISDEDGKFIEIIAIKDLFNY